MPAKSVKQRRAMAIAQHEPERLYSKNKGLKKMSKKQLREFSETKDGKLPMKKKPVKKQKRGGY